MDGDQLASKGKGSEKETNGKRAMERLSNLMSKVYNKYKKKKIQKRKPPVFLSFIEEGIMNPKYAGYVGGRLEVYRKGPYADEEIRFFTKERETFESFREHWDFEHITENRLKAIRELMTNMFQDYSELPSYE